jgi:acetylornithine/N-succinyldiaminopimelate aminotransferase
MFRIGVMKSYLSIFPDENRVFVRTCRYLRNLPDMSNGFSNRHNFLQYLAQTSPEPVGLEIATAIGSQLIDIQGKKYLDLIGGISVCNIGHNHPAVIAAITQQANAYSHVMVYGEFIEGPQVQYAHLLAQHLPDNLQNIYFTNSGSEATEGAIKLARRATGRTKILAAHLAYHGSTTGALSLMGDEYWRNSFRPLMPGVEHYDYNSVAFIDAITHQTACVVLETVQGEAGVVAPEKSWIAEVRDKCTSTGTLLILDEIQTGFGRTGKLWCFEHFSIVPDILLLGKALGGSMPLGAFVASRDIMSLLTNNPVLGHITTFGGHPVCCAAGMAAMQILLDEGIIESVSEKEHLFRKLLVHPQIKAVRSKGLLIAVELESSEKVQNVLKKCLTRGVFSDWFLFSPHSIRIAPPLTITYEEIEFGCKILLECLDTL